MAPVTIAGAVVQQMPKPSAASPSPRWSSAAPRRLWRLHFECRHEERRSGLRHARIHEAVIVGGQLARRYGIPYRTSNTNAANTLDAQAAYESVFSLWR